MYLVIKSREVVCNSLLKLKMVSGMFFFERVEIEILEWEYNFDFVKKFEKDFILIINIWVVREIICILFEK